MKITSLRLIVTLALCLISRIGFAQRPAESNVTCINPEGSQRAHNRIMFFLTFSNREEDRIEVGAINENIEQIRPVADETICSALSQIVLDNPDYKEIDENLEEKDTKYYYRTDNFYYIFWTRKPEYDNWFKTGPQEIFLVVSTDFEQVWEYYY